MGIAMNNCQKFRHFLNLSMLILFVSCGKKVVNSVESQQDLVNKLTAMSIETECNLNNSKPSKIFQEGSELINQIRIFAPQAGGEDSADFNYLNPMIANEKNLTIKLEEIRKKFYEGIVDSVELDKFDRTLNRFEYMRCHFSELELKKDKDIRPYLISIHNNQVTDENLMSMCQKLEGEYYCTKEIAIYKSKNQLEDLKKKYLARFETDIVNQMFQLAKNHTKFRCNKNENKVVLNLDLSIEKSNAYVGAVAKDSIEKYWKNANVEIKVEIKNTTDEKTINLINIKNSLSHVQSAEPKNVYINEELSDNNLSQTLAHEFGHILGFPDCYIEFFNSKKNELIYYELSGKNNNIMCGIKSTSKVLDSYLEELAQKSCIF